MTIITGNEIPTTVEAMVAFLQPLVTSGFADDVAAGNETVYIKQNDTTMVSLWHNTSSTTTGWGGAVPNASGSSHSVGNDVAIQKIALCKGGVIFKRSDAWLFAIAKTNEGKIGWIPVRDQGYASQYNNPYYTTCLGDNTSLALWTNGYKVYRNSDSGDRTILTKLPVVGTTGSNDYFSTVFAKNIVQWAEDGLQLIGGKQYVCIGPFAMLDE